jgi:hypothetical protein
MKYLEGVVYWNNCLSNWLEEAFKRMRNCTYDTDVVLYCIVDVHSCTTESVGAAKSKA